MNYTKGEWIVETSTASRYGGKEYFVTLNDRQPTVINIAYMPYGQQPDEQRHANAHLISASPDMYEELKGAIEWLSKFVMKFYVQAENPTYEKMKVLYQELDEFQRNLGTKSLAKAEDK